MCGTSDLFHKNCKKNMDTISTIRKSTKFLKKSLVSLLLATEDNMYVYVVHRKKMYIYINEKTNTITLVRG
jgi:uncharacterized protein with PhoU and TrkA domain